ncbi:unnamed protein product [Cylicocyclus nassatus]|uniref:ShKT domain-containing protein n=1 Tax=Cylicocyclus nassatus TaxID=53992 RepID=A0AA36M917_CYLNA|nr:unnamed protein product [Cylicocyclus nassatus]
MEMLQVVVIVSMCFAVHGAVTYEVCLDKNKKYKEKAFACQDKLPEASCKALYPPGGLRPGDDTDRAANSPSATSNVDKNILKVALENCAKTCAVCCKSPIYDCEDRSIGCAQWKNQCKDQEWVKILDLAYKCPKTCGLCEEEIPGCKDVAKNCDKTLCGMVEIADIMKEQCKKTCGYCDITNTTTPANTTTEKPIATTQNGLVPTSASKESDTTIPCGAHQRCAIWNKNGFCNNTFYPYEYKRRFCGKDCGIC